MTSNVQRYMLLDSTRFPKVFIEDFNQGLTPYTYTGNTPISNYYEITQTIQGNTLYQKGNLSPGGIDAVLTRTIPVPGPVTRFEVEFISEARNLGVASYVELSGPSGSYVRLYPFSQDRDAGANTPGLWVSRRVNAGSEIPLFLANPINLNEKHKAVFTFGLSTVNVQVFNSTGTLIASGTQTFNREQLNNLVFYSSLFAGGLMPPFNYYDNILVEYE